MADEKLTELAELAAPAETDLLYAVADPAGTPASKRLTIASLLALSPGQPVEPQLRLTLESGVPLSTTDQTAKSVLYATPYKGNKLWLYNGTKWVQHSIAEFAIPLAGLTSSKGYDVFAFASAATPSATSTGSDTVDFAAAPGWSTGAVATVAATGGGLTAGTSYWLRAVDADTYSFHSTLDGALANTGTVDLTDTITAAITAVSLELSAAWATATARTDALTTQDGWYVKSGAATRLHLGGFYSSGTTTTEMSARKWFLSNRYNALRVGWAWYESADHTYSTATWRQSAADAARKIELFDAIGDRAARISADDRSSHTAAGVLRRTGVGIDSTTTPAGITGESSAAAIGHVVATTAVWCGVPGLGYHYAAWLEWCQGILTCSWKAGSGYTAGMAGDWLC